MIHLATLLAVLPVCRSACPATTITSSTPFSRVDRGGGVFTPSVQIPTYSVWATIPGAQYIWESNSYTFGPFKFVATFSMAEWARQSISSIRLLIACDNFFSIVFNGVVIAPQWSGDFSHVWSYELKPYVLGSDATLGFRDNELVIYAYNTDGPAGLIYKLEVVY